MGEGQVLVTKPFVFSLNRQGFPADLPLFASPRPESGLTLVSALLMWQSKTLPTPTLVRVPREYPGNTPGVPRGCEMRLRGGNIPEMPARNSFPPYIRD